MIHFIEKAAGLSAVSQKKYPAFPDFRASQGSCQSLPPRWAEDRVPQGRNGVALRVQLVACDLGGLFVESRMVLDPAQFPVGIGCCVSNTRRY